MSAWHKVVYIIRQGAGYEVVALPNWFTVTRYRRAQRDLRGLPLGGGSGLTHPTMFGEPIYRASDLQHAKARAVELMFTSDAERIEVHDHQPTP